MRRSDRYARQSESIVLIALVIPDPELASLYRLKLELDGYRVVALAESEVSEARLAAVRPDIVIADVRGGAGLLPRLRALLPPVPLLLLSDVGEPELRKRGALLPFEHVLVPYAGRDAPPSQVASR